MARSTRHTVRALSGLAALSLLSWHARMAQRAHRDEGTSPHRSRRRSGLRNPAAEACSYPMTVTDMVGNEVTIDSVDSVVVTDNRMFAVLNEWGIHPGRAAHPHERRIHWKNDESILDTGSPGEPNFEQVVAADPTIIINSLPLWRPCR